MGFWSKASMQACLFGLAMLGIMPSALATQTPHTAGQALQPARIHALVIGIDRYRFLPKLTGARHDAEDIADMLEGYGVKDVTLLLDEQAHRQAIQATWETLLKNSQAGDILFVSYAGHGGQEPEHQRGQEADGLDEVTLLAGFTPQAPGNRQRILDDEWREWITLALQQDRQVVMLFDSCHSGSASRQAIVPNLTLPTRFAGEYRIEGADELATAATRSVPSLESPQGEIYLSGVRDDQVVREIMLDGKPRGAMSYFFARGLRGAADLNADQKITYPELREYLHNNIQQETENLQTPTLNLPRDATQTVFNAVNVPPLLARPKAQPLALAIVGGTPDRLQNAYAQLKDILPAPPNAAQLVWRLETGQILSGQGDFLGAATSLEAVQAEIRKQQTLQQLRRWAEQNTLSLRLESGAKRYRAGENVRFVIGERTGQDLTLVNIASGGVLNYLYPLADDPLGIAPRGEWLFPPLSAPALTVTPPYGADHLLAIASRAPQTELRKALRALDGQRAATELPALLADFFQNQPKDSYAIGMVGLFTGE